MTSTPSISPDPPAEAIDPVRHRRQCARCRKHFELPADLHPGARHEWWVCPPCHAALLPSTTPRP
jgi:hypothetical protein